MSTSLSPNRRAAIARSIANVERRLIEARKALAETSVDLVEKPDSADVQASLASLEATIDKLEREKGRLDRASEEASRQETAAGKAALVKYLKEQAALVDELGRQMLLCTEKIVERIEDVGPLLSKFAILARDREAIARGLFREGDSHATRRINRWSGFSDLAVGRGSALATAVAAACWRAGLGRNGPILEGLVTTLPTHWDSPYPRNEELRALLRDGAAEESLKLAGAVRGAIATVEGL